jgi:hypothetical protein
MPRLLDDLLNKKCDFENLLEEKSKHLTEYGVEFIILGLAYHISRKEDYVRLSKN